MKKHKNVRRLKRQETAAEKFQREQIKLLATASRQQLQRYRLAGEVGFHETTRLSHKVITNGQSGGESAGPEAQCYYCCMCGRRKTVEEHAAKGKTSPNKHRKSTSSRDPFYALLAPAAVPLHRTDELDYRSQRQQNLDHFHSVAEHEKRLRERGEHGPRPIHSQELTLPFMLKLETVIRVQVRAADSDQSGEDVPKCVRVALPRMTAAEYAQRKGDNAFRHRMVPVCADCMKSIHLSDDDLAAAVAAVATETKAGGGDAAQVRQRQQDFLARLLKPSERQAQKNEALRAEREKQRALYASNFVDEPPSSLVLRMDDVLQLYHAQGTARVEASERIESKFPKLFAELKKSERQSAADRKTSKKDVPSSQGNSSGDTGADQSAPDTETQTKTDNPRFKYTRSPALTRHGSSHKILYPEYWTLPDSSVPDIGGYSGRGIEEYLEMVKRRSQRRQRRKHAPPDNGTKSMPQLPRRRRPRRTKASMGISAGKKAPTWLHDNGVPSFDQYLSREEAPFPFVPIQMDPPSEKLPAVRRSTENKDAGTNTAQTNSVEKQVPDGHANTAHYNDLSLAKHVYGTIERGTYVSDWSKEANDRRTKLDQSAQEKTKDTESSQSRESKQAEQSAPEAVRRGSRAAQSAATLAANPLAKHPAFGKRRTQSSKRTEDASHIPKFLDALRKQQKERRVRVEKIKADAKASQMPSDTILIL